VFIEININTLNAKRPKDRVKFIAVLLYLLTECLTQHMAEKCANLKLIIKEVKIFTE